MHHSGMSKDWEPVHPTSLPTARGASLPGGTGHKQHLAAAAAAWERQPRALNCCLPAEQAAEKDSVLPIIARRLV